MPIIKSKQRLWQEKKSFCTIRTFIDLARTVVCPPRRLYDLIYYGKYKEFEIPKGKGKFRYIETPYRSLKEIQFELNRYLQATYFFERPPVAYGFMINACDTKPRNILSNAQQHIGRPYLVNIDLESFFHQIKQHHIYEIFKQKPFHFSKEIASKLTRLTTYKGRLPMGTSTSPVLSNFATLSLDKALMNMAKQKNWAYTRYVDDLSFSSEQQIKLKDLNSIKRLITNFGFKINEDKIQIYDKGDLKEVTGLIVEENQVRLPSDFIIETQQEIEELKKATNLVSRYGKFSEDWSDTLRRRVRGRINYLGFIRGKQDAIYRQLLHEYKEAIIPPSDYVPVSWNNFSYCNMLTCN